MPNTRVGPRFDTVKDQHRETSKSSVGEVLQRNRSEKGDYMQRIKPAQRFSLAFIATFLVLFTGVIVIETRGVGSKIPEVTLSRPARSLTNPVTLKIVTFNIQDTPIVSTNRSERMQAIAVKLCSLDPDIVGFQELFVKRERDSLIEKLTECSRLQHHQYYPSWVVGSGLLLSSAFPIAKQSFLQFADSNPFYKLTEGDWWAGKGVALARIELPEGSGFVDVYNTHAQAGYGNAEYEIVRKNQMTELALYVNKSTTAKTPALLVGDMNCHMGSVDCAAAVDGARLLRLMSIDSGVDHIFAVGKSDYRFELLSTVRIEEQIDTGREIISLSDHSGYMSTIRIIPLFNLP